MPKDIHESEITRIKIEDIKPLDLEVVFESIRKGRERFLVEANEEGEPVDNNELVAAANIFISRKGSVMIMVSGAWDEEDAAKAILDLKEAFEKNYPTLALRILLGLSDIGRR